MKENTEMNKMKRSIIWTMAIILTSIVMMLGNSMKASAAICSSCGGAGRKMCMMCVGVGQKSTTIYQYKNLGYGTIMVPITQWTACTYCSGSGRTFCVSCNGTGQKNNSGGASDGISSGEISKTVKNGTVIDATDGIGNYEDAPNLLDGKKDTKFNVKATKAYIIWKAPAKMSVSLYTITTANDTATYKGRNPKNWTLYGSNEKLAKNATGWNKIHSVENDTILKAVNYTSFTYKLKSAAPAYQYYKLEIISNQGADCTQLAEFTLSGKTVTDKSESSLKSQSITAGSFTKIYGDKAFSIGAKTSGNGKLTYSSSNTKIATVSSAGKVTLKGVGTANITITAAGTSTYNKATKVIKVIVKPKSTVIVSLKNSKASKLTIKWKRNSTVTGYKFQVADNSSFKNSKTYTVSSNRTVSKMISVTRGKTYYVRICTYKGSLTSGWSGTKKLKIKK